ncbi:rod shape-determining protein MreC [Enterococcus columbae]|uniref:Cell shape-determining protein MreC n=2 Tax=Bacteria TaxID=2 RepID=S1P3P8_9ENTE|nr:rod shape-determining protein MreC [Enterococcus columbae]EOT38630.1 rod shape-determining protein MreC [Enterococcus columbae DSM 7374 = ATCC 51263]EOW87719.1 rod shape-determining protein MreC [Enterococcus columbae DSM 7374 = ATCC 51263]OJG20500.1 rod shape-determining protein MreC [Enterococcus columbae DSM 7374 = ATCC 51263]
MKKFNSNKNIIIALIVVIVVVAVLSLTIAKRASQNKTNFLQSAVNDSVALVDKILMAPVHLVTDTATRVSELFQTYEENQQLKAKIDAYDQLLQKEKNNEREIEQLKSELELNATLTSYEKQVANVISRSPDTWQDLLVIDKGSKNGIEVNMAVMAKKGLIGRVIEVNQYTSKVELLSSKNETSNHFPVRISTKSGEIFGILKDYDQKQDLLIVEDLTGASNVDNGDVVQTSGLGGNSPADLMVGKVVNAKTDSFGLAKQLYVKPAADATDLSVVTVIKRSVEVTE